jgi:ribosome biogenesis protein SSF1/2
VRAMQRRPIEVSQAYKTAPLVVLNNFSDASARAHVKLMKITLQNMFPTINVAEVKLADCRRIVLFHYDKATGEVEMRHYAIRAAPTGITRAIKKVSKLSYAVVTLYSGSANCVQCFCHTEFLVIVEAVDV